MFAEQFLCEHPCKDFQGTDARFELLFAEFGLRRDHGPLRGEAFEKRTIIAHATRATSSPLASANRVTAAKLTSVP